MSLFPKLRTASVTVIVISFMIIMIIRLYRLVNPSRLGRKVAINSRRPLQTDHRHRHSMNEFRTQLKDQAASFVRREEHEHAQLSRQFKNISAFTPDRSPNLGLVRVLERAIKEAKEDLRPRTGSEVCGGVGAGLRPVRVQSQGSRFKVQGSRFKVQGSRFKVQRFKVQAFKVPLSSRRWAATAISIGATCL